VPQPGTGLASNGANAQACPVGFYSYGYARRPCARCPRTFTTAGAGAASKWKCGGWPGVLGLGLRGSTAAWEGLPHPASTAAHPAARAVPCRPRPLLFSACPPGYRYNDDSAVPCGFGYYKPGIDFAVACTRCAAGLTTPTTTAGSAADCRLAAPGYKLVKSGDAVTGAAPCGAG
jgi:hypothetical protein